MVDLRELLEKIKSFFEKKPTLKPAINMLDVVYTPYAEDLDLGGENACRIVIRDKSGNIIEELPFSWHLIRLFEDKGFIIDEELWEAHPAVKPSEFLEMRGITFG